MKRTIVIALVAILGVLAYQPPAAAHNFPPSGSPVYCGHDFAIETDPNAPEQNFRVYVWFRSHWNENVGGQLIHRHRYYHTGTTLNFYEPHYRNRGCGVV